MRVSFEPAHGTHRFGWIREDSTLLVVGLYWRVPLTGREFAVYQNHPDYQESWRP
ncbi:hypothetical protein ACIBSV_46855 [Embleya sp. NPDC050154]|uniref:hypothetical protein n=1 Tax=Embleya sp. NPDC050154 TaxID=3363988 RepID=UPI00378FF60A